VSPGEAKTARQGHRFAQLKGFKIDVWQASTGSARGDRCRRREKSASFRAKLAKAISPVPGGISRVVHGRCLKTAMTMMEAPTGHAAFVQQFFA
jgi:hypothetical protein